MLKPDSLRQFLTAAIPAFRADADRLQIFVDRGTVRALGGASEANIMAFEYRYSISIIALDLALHPDVVFTALLSWVGENQPELLENFNLNQQGISFEVDVLDAGKIDLRIELPLTERVGSEPRPEGGVVHRTLARTHQN